jgi:hypothetical protein
VKNLSENESFDSDSKKNLEEEYLKILHLIREIDHKFQTTNDQEEMLFLIKQREPLSQQLDDVYNQLTEYDKQEREAIIKEALKIGGITMQGKEIKMHKNGVKISVSKAYIDDKMLDAKSKYTVILIPE